MHMALPQDQGSRLAPQACQNPSYSSHNPYASMPIEVSVSKALSLSYLWLPWPAVPKEREETLEDQIGQVLIQPSLAPQVAVWTQGIMHFW